MTDILKLLSSEATELSAAAGPQCDTFLDESLPPRKLAIWLLAKPLERAHDLTDNYLDALGHWAAFKVNGARVVNSIRMSAAFGVDADYICSHTLSEGAGPGFTALNQGDIKVAIRWFDGARTRTEIHEFERLNTGATIMCTLQDQVVKLVGRHDATRPPALFKPVSESVVGNEFYLRSVEASSEFFSLTQGVPSITKTPYAVANEDKYPLQNTGVKVRVVDKRLGKDGISNTACFHGALLSMGNKRSQSVEFAQRCDDLGLRMPLSKDETELGLHLCAVQAEGLPLGRHVSLFGVVGIAGKQIHSPGSWIWVSRPAVRPVDAGLLNTFSLFPCSVESLLPSRSELVPAFDRFWSQTTSIFRMLGACPTGIVPNDSFTSVATTDYAPSSDESVDSTPSQEELMMAMTMQIDMKSERTTLGDAYAHMVRVGGPNAITDNMKQAMASLGVRASLYDMFAFNNKAARAYQELDGNIQNETSCLRKLCEVALSTVHQSSRKRKADELLAVPAERVRRVLALCGRQRGTALTLQQGMIHNSVVGPLIALVGSAVDVDIKDKGVIGIMTRHVARMEVESSAELNWARLVETTIGTVAGVSIVAGCKLCSLFMIVSSVGADEIEIKEVEPDGRVVESSSDRMCRIRSPNVLILQRMDKAKVRITSTVPTATAAS